MLAKGFLGTRADLLMDIVVIGITLTPFIMLYSFRLVHRNKEKKHKNIMLILVLILMIVVILFETDIRISGGTKAFVEGSSYANTMFFKIFFIIHIIIAILSFLSWLTLAILSWKRYPNPLPGSFSSAHKKYGHMIFGGVILTAITGIGMYIMGYIL
ncbi:MAG: DUF420 domain-containing protein [Spirochaetota bacterium]|nr:DUF420 domain-containing protein [Spirochaetota bacterium]